VVTGIVYVIKHGLQWKDAPRGYGPHKTLYNRFIRWSRMGAFNKVLEGLAGMRVRVEDGPPQRIGDLGQQHLPGEEVRLVGEHRSTGERNTTSAICPSTHRSGSWQAPSRPAGVASNLINS